MAKFKGTDGDDSFTLREGKRDVVRMLDGDDTVYLSAASFGSDDRVDGGAGFDQAIFTDGGFYNLGHDRFTGFEGLYFGGSGAFEIYVDNSVGQADQTLVIGGSGVTGDEANPASLFIDAAPERDAPLIIFGTTGDDVIIGGGQGDLFLGNTGNDLMTGNEGPDTFSFDAGQSGDNWGQDRITDFRPGEDRLVFGTDSVSSFDELLLDRTRDGLVVRTPDSTSSILLYGLRPRDLHASDVTFLPAQTDPVAHHALAVPLDHGPLA